MLVAVVITPGLSFGFVLVCQFGAVFGMLVAVGGIERFFQRWAATTSGEAESVGTIRDDFVAGEKSANDLNVEIVL